MANPIQTHNNTVIQNQDFLSSHPMNEQLNNSLLFYPSWQALSIMTKESPADTNVFSFLVAYAHELIHYCHDRTHPLHPFAILLSLADECKLFDKNTTEQTRKDFVEYFVFLNKKNTVIKRALGLENQNIKEKLFSDACRYQEAGATTWE